MIHPTASKTLHTEGCTPIQFNPPEHSLVADLEYTPLELVPFRADSFLESSRKRLRQEQVIPQFNLNLCSDSQAESPRLLKQAFRPTGTGHLGNSVGTSNSLPDSHNFFQGVRQPQLFQPSPYMHSEPPIPWALDPITIPLHHEALAWQFSNTICQDWPHDRGR